MPKNAYLKKATMNNNFIGQEVLIECFEGFEFTDPVEAYNHTEPETSTLGNIQ